VIGLGHHQPRPDLDRAMTSVATFRLNEARALALATALESDERLAALPVSLGETADGQWQVLVYFTANEAVEADALRRLSLAIVGQAAATFSVDVLPDVDWVAQSLEGLPPVRAGRFLVHGGHDRDALRVNDVGIEIEAGQAFGTGHHGTTAGCLLAIDRIARTRRIANALDIGTGSGVLAIAIAKATKGRVLASDIDPVAVRVARENIRLNGGACRVRAVAAGGLGKRVFKSSAPYDLIVANILAEPLMALAPQICRHLAPGGTLVLSGLLPGQRARIVAAYRGQGLPVLRAFVLAGWLTLVFGHRGRNRKGGILRLRLPSDPCGPAYQG
jgi:ribosomal protein L11 methyltransferase